MKNKRFTISVILGAILGIFCIIGAGLRLGFSGNELFLFATWYNRVILGIVIGLLPKTKFNTIIRGGVIGLVVSLSLFLATNFRDVPGFFAGVAYGMIIDYIASKYAK